MEPTANRVAAAEARPVVVAYDSGTAVIKDEVRAVVQASDGTLVVGSNVLAAFDGDRWQRIPLPGRYGFRALAAARDGPGGLAHHRPRVWVGGTDAVGYIEPDEARSWHFISLAKHLVTAGEVPVGDIWGVLPLGAGALWVTEDRAIRWVPTLPGDPQSGRFDVWHLAAASHLTAFGGGEEVFVYQDGVGLLRFGPAGPPKLVFADRELPERPVTWLISPTDAAAPAVIGLGDGAYLWESDGAIKRLPELSAALRGNLPTAAAALPDGRLAVATFNAGVVLANRTGQVLGRYLSSDGLVDNTVYALWGNGHHLWVGSAGGLARIDGVGTSTWFERHAALADGQSLKVLRHAGETYVVTTAGAFRESRVSGESGPALQPILQPSTPLADGVVTAGRFWISGFGGVWRVEGDQAEQELFAPEDVSQVCGSAVIPAGVLFIEGNRLKALQPSPLGDWADQDLGAEVPDTPLSLLEDRSHDVWVSMMRQGVMRFGWDKSGPPHLRAKARYAPGHGLLADAGRTELVALGSRLFAFTEAGILQLRPDASAFEAAPQLAALHGIAASDSRLTDGRVSGYWLVQARELRASGRYGVVRAEETEDGSLKITPLVVPGLDADATPNAISMSAEAAGEVLWIGINRGLLRVEASALRTADVPPAARIAMMRVDEQPASVGANGEVLPASERRTEFGFAVATGVAGETPMYQTRLLGIDSDWLAPTRHPTRAFDGLAAGHYRFDVRVLDHIGRAGPVTSYAFVLLAPWWKTWPAFAGYAALLVLVGALGARWQLARLRRQNERLNQLVAERTREIELASTAKSEFLENISHEIRNPLNGLTGLLRLLNETHLGPQEKDLARSLKSVAGTLNQAFEDVLQFSRLEYGYAQINRTPFALRPLLEEIVDLFTAQALQAGCTVRVVWPEGLADGFLGDAPKIRTIVRNFVSNALKYAPGAPLEIRVEADGESDGMVDLYIDVVDRGPGIPPDEHELIFRKFVRGKNAQAGKVAGTGLGLATCRVLAKLLNGSVGVESAPGQGATFYLKLLLPRTPLAALTEPAASAGEPLDVPGARVLVVDDESYNRVVLEGIARDLGLITDTAGSAREAAERLAGSDYAVVFLDWELPDGKGGDIARELRARFGSARPLIVATTAHDSDEMRERCLRAGMDGFLLKPYGIENVRRVLAEAKTARARECELPGDATEAPASEVDDALDLSAFVHYARARPDGDASASDLYVQAVETQARAVAEAVSSGQCDLVADASHRLRALSGLINAKKLNHAAARLEQLARSGRREEIDSAGADVHEACEALTRRLAGNAS